MERRSGPAGAIVFEFNLENGDWFLTRKQMVFYFIILFLGFLSTLFTILSTLVPFTEKRAHVANESEKESSSI